MRKILILALTTLSVLVAVTGCGGSNTVSTDQSEVQNQENQEIENSDKGNYSEDFDQIMDRIKVMNETSDEVSSFMVSVWRDAGTSLAVKKYLLYWEQTQKKMQKRHLIMRSLILEKNLDWSLVTVAKCIHVVKKMH